MLPRTACLARGGDARKLRWRSACRVDVVAGGGAGMARHEHREEGGRRGDSTIAVTPFKV